MPTLSIIIPVYNTERYLRECIESILTQSFTDFELILIDDGSTDRSGEICEEYKKKDNRIVFIKKENGGVSDARNVGITLSRGKYLLFCDSDDTMIPNALTEIIPYAAENDFDITMCTYVLDYENGTQPITEQINFNESIHSDMCSVISEYMTGIVPWSACRNIIKRSIVAENRIRYDKRYLSAEDCDFYFNVCKYAAKFASVNKPVIRYRAARDGSTSNTVSKVNTESISKVYYKWLKYFKTNYNGAAIEILHGLSNHYFYLMLESVKNNSDDEITDIFEKYKFVLRYVTGIKKRIFVIFCDIFGVKNGIKFLGGNKIC